MILISPCPVLGAGPLGQVASGASFSPKIPQWLLLERAVLLLDLPIISLFFMVLNLFWNVLEEKKKR